MLAIDKERLFEGLGVFWGFIHLVGFQKVLTHQCELQRLCLSSRPLVE